MTKYALLLAAIAASTACSGDESESSNGKVDIDEPAALLDPDGDGEVEAIVEMDVVSLGFELPEPLPEIDFRIDGTEDAAVLNLVSALTVTVSSPRTGVTATLAEDGGMMVPAPPNAPGEWSTELSDDRLVLTVSWFNGTLSGLTMKPGEFYNVVSSVTENCCVGNFTSDPVLFSFAQ